MGPDEARERFRADYRRIVEDSGKARQSTEKALAAGHEEDAEACLSSARAAAAEFLHVFLRFREADGPAGHDVIALVDAAAEQDHYFERLRPEAGLLMTADENAGSLACEDIIDALREIRMLAHMRAAEHWSKAGALSDLPPLLEGLVLHATTVERAISIFREGALLSHRGCVERGLLSGKPVGHLFLLDPRRWQDYVHFGSCDATFFAGEKVANSHRKGFVDEALEEDYQPSVRFLFARAELEAHPKHADDGCHVLMIRDEVSLQDATCVVFPTDEAKQAALAVVDDDALRAKLCSRSLVTPPECTTSPGDYAEGSNRVVVGWLEGRTK